MGIHERAQQGVRKKNKIEQFFPHTHTRASDFIPHTLNQMRQQIH
jgi:hypothetical protein